MTLEGGIETVTKTYARRINTLANSNRNKFFNPDMLCCSTTRQQVWIFVSLSFVSFRIRWCWTRTPLEQTWQETFKLCSWFLLRFAWRGLCSHQQHHRLRQHATAHHLPSKYNTWRARQERFSSALTTASTIKTRVLASWVNVSVILVGMARDATKTSDQYHNANQVCAWKM